MKARVLSVLPVHPQHLAPSRACWGTEGKKKKTKHVKWMDTCKEMDKMHHNHLNIFISKNQGHVCYNRIWKTDYSVILILLKMYA